MDKEAIMKQTKWMVTIGFLVYLAIVLVLLYQVDKRLVAVFCALGTALYVGIMKRVSDKQAPK